MKLFFRRYGEGRPLIILHGLFGQCDNWNTLAKRYSDNGFEVYTVDQRNHGLSPHNSEWNYTCMADDLMQLISDEHIVKPIIMGHSMGGKTCMFFESKYSGIASALIISDIAPRKYFSNNIEVLEALNSIDLNQIQSRKEAEVVLEKFGLNFGTRQFLLKNLYRTETSETTFGWRFNLNVISSNFNNVSEAVPNMRSETPVLFLKGESSDYISSEDEIEISDKFLNSRIEVIKGSGHWIHAEQPEEYFKRTFSFMENI
jgi:esterase